MDFQPWLAGKSPRWAEVLVVNSGIVQQTMFYKGIREPQEKTREHMCFFVPDVFFYSCFSSITLMTSWWPASSIKWCGKLTVNHPTFCQERMVTTIPQLEVLVRFTRLFWFILIHFDSSWFLVELSLPRGSGEIVPAWSMVIPIMSRQGCRWVTPILCNVFLPRPQMEIWIDLMVNSTLGTNWGSGLVDHLHPNYAGIDILYNQPINLSFWGAAAII